MNFLRKLFVCGAWAGAAAPILTAQNRFPKPEFTGGYSIPQASSLPATATDAERLWLAAAPYLQYATLAALLLFLLLSCYFLYRRRSRRAIFAITLASVAFFGFLAGGCLCAVGSIQNVAAAIFNPGVPISPVALGIFLLPLFFALFAGRVFCGSVCPLGAIQEVVNIRPLKIPPRLDRVLRLLPLSYLGLSVMSAATGIGFVICRFDPFIGIYRMSGPIFMLVAGGMLLLLGVFAARPYCRYLCPYGVLLGWCSRLSSRRVSVTPDECIRCRLCEDACPVDAIMPPSPPPEDCEPMRQSRHRTLWLLLWLPATAAAAGLAGHLAGNSLSLLHPQVALYRQVSAELAAGEQPQTDASLAFRSSGGTVVRLRQEAADAVSQVRLGSCLLGVFLALAIMARLLDFSKRRELKAYTVDHSLCVCCGRCYNACPRDKRNHRREENGP